MALFSDYADLEDFKRYLRIPGLFEGTINQEEDLADDIPLRLALTAASRAIDNATHRQFGLSDITQKMIYTPEYNKTYRAYGFDIDDLMTVSGIAINQYSDTTELFDDPIPDYTLYPRNAAVKGQPWTYVVIEDGSYDTDSVQIEAKWGWTAVPETIKQATLLQATRIFKRRDAPFGVTGSAELGSQLRLLNKVDPDVAVLVSPYKRWWGAG